MIQVKNLSKHYGTHPAVVGISFAVAEGEVVGFLGPNGAGKSTTIRILTCYQPASGGTARVAGHDVFTESMAVRQKVGYLPENAPLYPDMRVREYLRFRARLRGMPRADIAAAIRRVTDRCWLGDAIERPIGQLSKGFRQRVGLAEALLSDPPVLIFDEPTIGLDPTQIRETRNLIKELAGKHTVLLSSHILPEVEAVCQRTIIIAAGRIVASGSPGQLRERISGTSRLIAEVQAPVAEATGAIRAVDGVSKVDADHVDGWVRLTIEPARGKDPRLEIVKAIGRHGWGLREIRREVASLEDFFVQITAKAHEGA